MRRLPIIGIGLSCMMLSLISCMTQQISQDDIITFIDTFENATAYLDRRLAECQWEYYTRGRSDSLDFFRETIRDFTADTEKLAAAATYMSIVTDGTQGRKLQLIYRRILHAVVDSEPRIRHTIDSLAALHAAWMPIFEGQAYSGEQLRGLIQSEPDRSRRREAYLASSAVGKTLAGGLVSLVRLRNHYVSRLGYNSYYDLMLQADGVEKSEYVALLNSLDRISAEPYALALDSLKGILGQNDIRDWDLEFLFRRAETQAAPYYIARNQMPLVEATLGGLGFTLQAWPIYFEEQDSTIARPADNIMVINVPHDVRVPTVINDGVYSFDHLFRQVGQALYTVHIDPQDYLFAQAPAPCFIDGMARFIAGLAELDGWRRTYAGMPEPLVVALKAKRDFFRLYGLRLLLVSLKFEERMYAAPFADLDQVYTGLYERYMLMPPADAGMWAASIEYVTRPVRLQNRLLGECIAAQTYRYLTEKYGSVLDNQHTREFLVQNFYRFGGRDDWQTLLARGCGEKLNPAYYLTFAGD